MQIHNIALAIEMLDPPTVGGKILQPLVFTDVFDRSDLSDLPAIVAAVYHAGIVCVRHPTLDLVKKILTFQMTEGDRSSKITAKCWDVAGSESYRWMVRYGYDVFTDYNAYARAVIGLYT